MKAKLMASVPIRGAVELSSGGILIRAELLATHLRRRVGQIQYEENIQGRTWKAELMRADLLSSHESTKASHSLASVRPCPTLGLPVGLRYPGAQP